MTFFSGDGTSTPLFDEHMSEVLRRRALELGGLVLGFVALWLAAALWSYDIADPSPFSATTRAPENWMGGPGAVAADLLIRYFGLGAWAIPTLFGAWSARFLLHIGEERLWARLLAAPVMLMLAPIFASTHAVHESWQLAGTGLGGMLGDSAARGILSLLPFSPVTGLKILSLGLGGGLLASAAVALGFTMAELRAIGRWLLRSFIVVAALALHYTGRICRTALVSLRNRLEEKRRQRAEDVEKEEADEALPARNWRHHLISLGQRMSGIADSAFNRRETDAEPDRRGIESGQGSHVRPGAGRYIDDAHAPRIPAGRKTDNAGTVAPRVLHGPLDDDSEDMIERDLDEPDMPSQPGTGIERRTALPSVSAGTGAVPARQPKLAGENIPGHEPYAPPPLDILQRPVAIGNGQTSDAALEESARMLETVLEDYGVRGEIVAVRPGPVVTLYELEPAPGLKASRVIGLADDIARSMSALAARVSTVPGRSIIGIELPNLTRERVWLRNIFESPDYDDARFPLALALGKDISGSPVVVNLAKMPHLLIAGTTGSGKSVAINTMILSLLYRLGPDKCRIIMIDPKMLELSVYDNIPHLLAPVVTDPKKAIVALKWVVAEMEERYRKMSKLGVRNIDGYNARVRDALDRGEDFSRTVQTGFDEETGSPIYETETLTPEEMPFIVVVVDEMADLMMVAGKEIEACIQRLAQMARASGIHLIMATQRPSVDVITGTIKANFPTRISFQVTSKIDSRTILGEQGAEQLLGQGDMLYMAGGGRIRRVHGPFVSDEEVEEVVDHLRQIGQPDYVMAVTEGVDEEAQAAVDAKLGLAPAGDSDAELYDHAVAIVARDRRCSTSYIQRRLAIGYNKAARIVEMMEDQGVVTAADAVGRREILIEER